MRHPTSAASRCAYIVTCQSLVLFAHTQTHTHTHTHTHTRCDEFRPQMRHPLSAASRCAYIVTCQSFGLFAQTCCVPSFDPRCGIRHLQQAGAHTSLHVRVLGCLHRHAVCLVLTPDAASDICSKQVRIHRYMSEFWVVCTHTLCA